MKTGTAIFLGFIGFIFLLVFWGFSTYNTIVTMEVNTEKTWADVEADYQRRADLIPNLIAVVKDYAEYEQQTLTDVIEARSKATSITIDPKNITADELAAYQAAQSGVSSALNKLLAIVENYPDLKANQNYLELQSQLEGTENRIGVSRKRFNESVETFNAKIRRFPGNLFGFTVKVFFKADPGTEKVPDAKDLLKG